MTINQLHAITEKLIQQGCGRRKVTIDKSTFSHPLEGDGAVILDVASADFECVPILDADGYAERTKSGAEKIMMTLVMVGDKSTKALAAVKGGEE